MNMTGIKERQQEECGLLSQEVKAHQGRSLSGSTAWIKAAGPDAASQGSWLAA